MDSTPGMLRNCSVPISRLLNGFTADSVTLESPGQAGSSSPPAIRVCAATLKPHEAIEFAAVLAKVLRAGVVSQRREIRFGPIRGVDLIAPGRS